MSSRISPGVAFAVIACLGALGCAEQAHDGPPEVSSTSQSVLGAACMGTGQGTCDVGEACTLGFCERDTDGDGVGNSQDVDDDNDGLLDSLECPAIGQSGSFDRADLVSQLGIISSSNGDYDPDTDWVGWSTPGTVDFSEGQFVSFSSSSAHLNDRTDGLGVLGSPDGGGFAIFSFGTETIEQNFPTVVGERYRARYYIGMMPDYLNRTYSVDLTFGIDGIDVRDETDLTVPPRSAFPTYAAATAAEPGATSIDLDPHWQVVEFDFVATSTSQRVFFMINGSGAVIVVDALQVVHLPDVDGDGVPNCEDLDSDNDTINDVDEVGGIDLDGDGFADDRDGDPSNNGGLPSTAGLGLTGSDGDSDGAIDPYDVDSDDTDETDIGDGIGDDIDGTALSSADANGDGRVDSTVDPDRDGIQLPADFVPGAYRDGAPDQDGDGIADQYDLDDDDDGILDTVEGSGDADNDGIPNNFDLDSDNDGIPDAVEAGHQLPETGASNCVGPTRFNGFCDALETGDDSGNPNFFYRDTDDDGVDDYLDLDSDGDGIPDSIEAGHGADTDSDGRVNCSSVGSNGLCDDLETSADSGITDYGVAAPRTLPTTSTAMASPTIETSIRTTTASTTWSRPAAPTPMATAPRTPWTPHPTRTTMVWSTRSIPTRPARRCPGPTPTPTRTRTSSTWTRTTTRSPTWSRVVPVAPTPTTTVSSTARTATATASATRSTAWRPSATRAAQRRPTPTAAPIHRLPTTPTRPTTPPERTTSTAPTIRASTPTTTARSMTSRTATATESPTAPMTAAASVASLPLRPAATGWSTWTRDATTAAPLLATAATPTA